MTKYCKFIDKQHKIIDKYYNKYNIINKLFPAAKIYFVKIL